MRLLVQAPHVAIGMLLDAGLLLYLGQFLLVVGHIVGHTRANLLADALVDDVAARDIGTGIGEHPVEGLLGAHHLQVRHHERLVTAHQCQLRGIHLAILVGSLYTTVPVVLGNLGIALHDITHGIDTAKLLVREQSL